MSVFRIDFGFVSVVESFFMFAWGVEVPDERGLCS